MKTPVYLYYKDKIIENYRRLQQALHLCDVHYALKANSEPEILAILHEAGAKFDVASTEEFMRLIELGVTPERILCSLPVKPDEMIEILSQKGCGYFVFDHPQELLKLFQYAPNAKKILRIYATDLVKDSIEYGMNVNEFEDLRQNSPDFIDKIDGVTFFIRENEDLGNMRLLLDRSDYILSTLNHEKKLILNIGGSYRWNHKMNTEYYTRLNETLAGLQKKHNLTLMAEPGKGVIDSAGFLLTKVVMVKEMDGYQEVFIDAGDPTGVFKIPASVEIYEGIQHEIKKKIVYRFIGTTCNHRQLFVYPLKFEIHKGDILSLGGYGGYSICYSSHFHGWERPGILIR